MKQEKELKLHRHHVLNKSEENNVKLTYGTAHIQVYKQTHVTCHASRNLCVTRVFGSCDTRNTLLASDY